MGWQGAEGGRVIVIDKREHQHERALLVGAVHSGMMKETVEEHLDELALLGGNCWSGSGGTGAPEKGED